MRQWMRAAVALGWRGALVLALGLSLVAAWQGGAAVAQDGPAGAMAIRDHLTTGFPLVGAHQNIRCETCHVRGIFKNTPKTCEGCHTPSARISNVTITSSHVPTVQPCSVCHNQLSFAGARFNHSGVVPGACASCHNGTNAPGKLSGHVVTASSCDTCHRTSTWAGAGFDHAQVVPGTCASCHSGAVAAGRPPNHIPTTQACDTCHTNTVSFAAWTMNHAGVVIDCASCHGGGFGDIRSKPATHIPTSASCETCHLSTATFTLAAFKHEGIASGCASCHDGKGAGGKPAVHIPTAAPCETCHKSTTAFSTWTMNHTGIATGCAACHGGQFADVKTKPSTHLPTAAACETCHTSTASFKVASFNHTGIAAGCAACHDGKTATGKPALHIPTQAPCETCHKNTTAFSTLTMDHTGITAGCAACHGGQFGDVRAQPPTAHIPTSAPCESCHKSTTVFSTWTMNHGGIATGCATCHGGQFADVKTKPPTHLPTAAACETCHSSTASFKVASFNHTGIVSGCAACHDGKTATGKPALHIPTQAPCETCHKSTTAFSTLTMDHTGIASGCAACHGGQFSDVVSLPPAHVPTAAACETCHVPTKFTNFSGGTMNHQGIVSGCATCHASGKTFVGVTVVTAPATHIPFAGAACEACHAPSKFTNFGGTAMSHGPVSGIACATCHEAGRTWSGVTIVTRPSPGQDPNHPLTGECGFCHTSTTSFAAGIISGKPANHIPTNETCALCHSNPANYAAYTMSHQNITSGCVMCHATGLSFANIVPVSPPATHVPFGSAACETCHAPNKFTNFSGTAMNHAAVPGVACATCHGPGKAFYGIAVVTPPATHIPFAGAACEACHAPGKFTNFSGTSMSHGPVSAISCATCHEAGKTWYGVTIVTRPTPAQDPSHPIGGECGICHSSTTSFAAGVTGGKPANHIPTVQACTLCHSNPSNYQIFAMNHAGITGSCATCHGPGLAFANIVPVSTPATHVPYGTAQCESCHLATKFDNFSGTAMNHAPVSGVACATCHASGKSFYGITVVTPPATHIPFAGAACETCHVPTKFTNFGGTAMNHGPVSSIACATCHEAGKSWFGVTIVTRPTPAADPNHPTTGDCGTCHTSTTSFATGIQGLPANHIPTGQACALCHHNPGGVMKPGIMNHQGITSNCTQCHLAAPAGKAFLGVTPVAQGNGHVPTSASCDTCHSGFQNFSGGQMKHTGISSGCATCHATGKTFTGVNVVTPPATHIPFAGAACETCHVPTKFTNFGGTAMNHGPVSGIACATCHETGKSWFGVTIVTRPTPAQDPSHPAAGDCGTCHTSTTSFSTGVQGLPANHIPTAQACALCHHNPGGVMKPGIMNHQGTTSNCTQCHLAAPAGKAFLGVTPVAQGNGHIPTSASCERCHAGFANFSGGKMDHTGIASGCATCHASGKTFAGVTVVTPPATHIPFAGAACEACHLATKFTNFSGTPMNHAAVTSISCATCHGASKSWFGVAIVTLPSTGHIPNPSALDCKGCHTSTTSFKTWKMSHSGITTNCVNCHGGQFPGVEKKPNDHPQTSNVCESCHSVNSFDKVLLLPAGKALLLGTAKPSGAANASGPAVVGKPGLAAAANPHLGIAPGSCASCHNGVNATAKPGRHLVTTLSCDNCHRTTAWVPASFTHRGVVPTTCATCHNGSAASARPSGHFATTRSCDNCHRMTSWRPPMAYRHLTLAYSPHPGVACVTCHKGNSEMVVWRFPAAKPDCAGCHQNMPKPGPKPAATRVGPARAN